MEEGYYINMEDLSLHILDIAENSVAAGATRIEIRIIEDIKKDILSIEIKDNGRGMTEEELRKADDPFYTTRKTRKVGLGLSLLTQSAKEAEGDISITSGEGKGTVVCATFKHSHIDRRPVGNIADTLIVLISGNPDIDFSYEHKKDNKIYSIETRELRAELGEIPLNAPDVIKVIAEDIRMGLRELG